MINLKNKNSNIILSFILGGLIDKADDYIDAVEPLKPNEKYIKYFLELIIVCIAIYFVHFNKETWLLYTYTAVILGTLSFFFAPHMVDSYLWYILMAIAFLKFVLTFKSMIEKKKTLSKKDHNAIVYLIIPSIIIALCSIYVEDILIPEEASLFKLISRFIFLLGIILFIIYSNKIRTFFEINDNFVNTIIYGLYCLLGYILSSNITQFRELFTNPRMMLFDYDNETINIDNNETINIDNNEIS